MGIHLSNWLIGVLYFVFLTGVILYGYSEMKKHKKH